MQSKTISIRNAFSFGLDFMKNNIKFVISIIIILYISGLFPLIDKTQHLVLYRVLNIIAFLVLYLYGIELIHISGCWYDCHSVTIKDLKLPPSLILRHFLGMVIFSLCTFLATLLLVVPGIYFFLTYYFFQYFIIDKSFGIRESFKSSSKITKGVKWELFGFFLIVYIPSFVSFLIMKYFSFYYTVYIQIIFNFWSVLAGLVAFHIYRQLYNYLEEDESSIKQFESY